VLVVPAALESLCLERMLVCWKDTRESRRAIVDAMPLLKKASRVTIVEIAADEQLPGIRNRLDDVAIWLKRHGVAAMVQATASAVDPGSALCRIADEHDIDVIIAGAYGHSRVREWAFGGVTRGMLMNTQRCSLLSH
jgi:nucleotide-binding universal stress UspA family protein